MAIRLDNAFTFGVGSGSILSGQTPEQQTQNLLSIPEIASRYPGMIGHVMIVGGAFAHLWLWKPIARVPWLSEAIAQKKIAIDKAMVKFVIIGVILLLASGVAMICAGQFDRQAASKMLSQQSLAMFGSQECYNRQSWVRSLFQFIERSSERIRVREGQKHLRY